MKHGREKPQMVKWNNKRTTSASISERLKNTQSHSYISFIFSGVFTVQLPYDGNTKMKKSESLCSGSSEREQSPPKVYQVLPQIHNLSCFPININFWVCSHVYVPLIRQIIIAGILLWTIFIPQAQSEYQLYGCLYRIDTDFVVKPREPNNQW